MRELSLNNCRLDGRYDILEELGRGSYAEVFLARDRLAPPNSPHSLVVIKALNVFLQDDLDSELERTLVENFQNEAVALDRVRHPNIISRLGHGTARDLAGVMFHYLVLEYMEGGNLQRAAREQKLSLKTCLNYIEQISAGVRHAHNNGVIHRDIKPQNLLLSKDHETVKIADFGVARIHQNDSPITRVGTNIYAPPEHSPLSAGIESVMTVTELTPAADIYSLAKSFYTIATGETPRFYANQPITDLPIFSRNEKWAPELLRVLSRATQREPRARYQSVDEFWTDLEPLRRIAAENDAAFSIQKQLHRAPQAHIASGFTPMAPREPKFNTSRDLKLRHPLIEGQPPRQVEPSGRLTQPIIKPTERVEDLWPNAIPRQADAKIQVILEEKAPKQLRPKTVSRRVLLSAAMLVLLAGGLYGTSVFLRSVGILPAISNPFAAEIGRTNTDVNLRPEPSANNEPIGVVTKNSRLRIVKKQNNWYQVDVLEQGRERSPPLPVSRGWLNGKYVDLE
jgi:serine/threonine protein kinase